MLDKVVTIVWSANITCHERSKRLRDFLNRRLANTKHGNFEYCNEYKDYDCFWQFTGQFIERFCKLCSYGLEILSQPKSYQPLIDKCKDRYSKLPIIRDNEIIQLLCDIDVRMLLPEDDPKYLDWAQAIRLMEDSLPPAVSDQPVVTAYEPPVFIEEIPPTDAQPKQPENQEELDRRWVKLEEECVVNRDKQKQRGIPEPLIEGLRFAPRGEISGLAAMPHFGKSSDVCQEVAMATQKGMRVLYIALDQGWALTSRYLQAYGYKNDNVFLLAKPRNLTPTGLTFIIERWQPDIFIVDTMLHLFARVIPMIADLRIRNFDENNSQHWLKATDWWLDNYIEKHNISGYGLYHSMKTSPWTFPHATTATAQMQRADILVPRRFITTGERGNAKLFTESWVMTFMAKQTEDSILRLCVRDRDKTADERYSQLYRYADDYDREIFGDDVKGAKPRPIKFLDKRVTFKTNTNTPSDLPISKRDSKAVYTVDDVIFRMFKLAKEKTGEEGAVTESAILRALGCPPKNSNQWRAKDAENRRELYRQAKLHHHVGTSGDSYKGIKVWVKPDYLKPPDSEATRTRGGQDT